MNTEAYLYTMLPERTSFTASQVSGFWTFKSFAPYAKAHSWGCAGGPTPSCMMANLKALLSITAVIAIGNSQVAFIRSMRYLLIVVLDLLASSVTMHVPFECIPALCLMARHGGSHVILHDSQH
jgi:hypothetical protein